MLIVDNPIQAGLRHLLAGAVRLFIGPLAAGRWRQLFHSGWLDERQVSVVVGSGASWMKLIHDRNHRLAIRLQIAGLQADVHRDSNEPAISSASAVTSV